MPHNPSILIVDDDDIFRDRLAVAFRDRGFEVMVAGDVQDALIKARLDPPELAVVDLKMPGGSGLTLVEELKRMEPATSVVVLTGYGSIATAIDAIKLGATHYLAKPADFDDIMDAFARNAAPPNTEVGDSHPTPSLARAEWEHINRVLSDSGGNISEAARRLRIHRRSLQRKLAKYPPRT